MIRHAFNDPHWGQFVVFRPTPIAGDIWGELAPAKGTPWEKLIPVIPGELLSHALYGRTMDLIERLGNDPRKLGQKLPPLAKICVDAKSCDRYDSKRSSPTAKRPDCYRALYCQKFFRRSPYGGAKVIMLQCSQKENLPYDVF